VKILCILRRKGGFLGLRQKLTVFIDGNVEFTDEKSGVKFSKKLAPEVKSRLERLLEEASQHCGERFYARLGAADYYRYILYYDGCVIHWVDEPVSEEPIPRVLREVGDLLIELMEI